VGFELLPNSKPFYGRPYNIPVALEPTVREEIDTMKKNKVIIKISEDTEWASPTFAVKKKTDGVRLVSDFRQLNKCIKRSPWPMPTIREMLHRGNGMRYATALDQILSYYSISIKKKIQKLLTIIMP